MSGLERLRSQRSSGWVNVGKTRPKEPNVIAGHLAERSSNHRSRCRLVYDGDLGGHLCLRRGRRQCLDTPRGFDIPCDRVRLREESWRLRSQGMQTQKAPASAV